jgi:hypothetical protein
MSFFSWCSLNGCIGNLVLVWLVISTSWGMLLWAFVLFLRKCIYTGVGVMSGRIVMVIVQVFLVS